MRRGVLNRNKKEKTMATFKANIQLEWNLTSSRDDYQTGSPDGTWHTFGKSSGRVTQTEGKETPSASVTTTVTRIQLSKYFPVDRGLLGFGLKNDIKKTGEEVGFSVLQTSYVNGTVPGKEYTLKQLNGSTIDSEAIKVGDVLWFTDYKFDKPKGIGLGQSSPVHDERVTVTSTAPLKAIFTKPHSKTFVAKGFVAGSGYAPLPPFGTVQCLIYNMSKKTKWPRWRFRFNNQAGVEQLVYFHKNETGSGNESYGPQAVYLCLPEGVRSVYGPATRP
jgi:hypothetical protein